MVNTVTAATTGTMILLGIYLRAGQTVANVNLICGATAPTASTHLWVALYSPARALYAQSTDDVSATPWTANTKKTIALSSAQTVTSSGLHYIGLLETVSSGNMPSFDGVNVNLTAISTELPLLRGDSDAALTTTAPPTASALVALNTNNIPYMWLT